MSQDYQAIVLATYKKMRDDGELLIILPSETTTKLKKACLKVYDNRFNHHDADILSVFFNKDKMGSDFRKVILDAESDDFKALLNHIQGKTESTDEKNSDLLAWLIDFEFRPSIKYYKNLKENSTNDTPLPPTVPPTTPDSESVKDPKPPLSISFISIVSTVILIIGYGAFLFWEIDPISIRVPNSDEKCMYWKKDHYEPIKCNEKANGATIIPLNLEKLNHLQKITLPDTLTKNSIGKVWYTGRGTGREYFTDSGMHPVDTVKRLLPLTDYILVRYASYYRYLLIRLSFAGALVALLVICLTIVNRKRHKRAVKLSKS